MNKDGHSTSWFVAIFLFCNFIQVPQNLWSQKITKIGDTPCIYDIQKSCQATFACSSSWATLIFFHQILMFHNLFFNFLEISSHLLQQLKNCLEVFLFLLSCLPPSSINSFYTMKASSFVYCKEKRIIKDIYIKILIFHKGI